MKAQQWMTIALSTLAIELGLAVASPPSVAQDMDASDTVFLSCTPPVTNGFTRCNTQDGDNYLGYLRNGRPSGRGVYVYGSGDRYEGEWENGLPDGEGRFILQNDARFEGVWENGYIVRGSAFYPDGTRYEGTFAPLQYVDSDVVTSQPSGQGAFYFANGNRFEGEFFVGKPFGQGTFIHTTGTRCSGYFFNLNFDANNATCTYPNGQRYTGELRQARPHGVGTMYGTNGQVVYTGAFREGQPARFSGYGN